MTPSDPADRKWLERTRRRLHHNSGMSWRLADLKALRALHLKRLVTYWGGAARDEPGAVVGGAQELLEVQAKLAEIMAQAAPREQRGESPSVDDRFS